MGFTGAIIGVAIIAIVGLVFYDEISRGWDNFIEDVDAKAKAQTTNPAVSNGVYIGDLILTVNGDYDDRLFNLGESFEIKLGETDEGIFGKTNHGEIKGEWKNCFTKGTSSPASFIPATVGSLSPLDFAFVTGDDDFTVVVTLVGKSDNRIISTVDQSGLDDKVHVGTGFVQLPAHFETTHVAVDIPVQEYTAKITVPNHEINGMSAGKSFDVTIPIGC